MLCDLQYSAHCLRESEELLDLRFAYFALAVNGQISHCVQSSEGSALHVSYDALFQCKIQQWGRAQFGLLKACGYKALADQRFKFIPSDDDITDVACKMDSLLKELTRGRRDVRGALNLSFLYIIGGRSERLVERLRPFILETKVNNSISNRGKM